MSSIICRNCASDSLTEFWFWGKKTCSTFSPSICQTGVNFDTVYFLPRTYTTRPSSWTPCSWSALEWRRGTPSPRCACRRWPRTRSSRTWSASTRSGCRLAGTDLMSRESWKSTTSWSRKRSPKMTLSMLAGFSAKKTRKNRTIRGAVSSKGGKAFFGACPAVWRDFLGTITILRI